MKLRHILLILAAALQAASLTSCREEDTEPATGTAIVRCALQTRAADNGTGPETLPNELINNWWIAFADASGTVRRIVANDPALTVPVEEDRFTVELPAATYTLYAFANISPAEVRRLSGLDFAVGTRLDPAEAAAACAVIANNPDPAGLIPMSGLLRTSFRKGTSDITVEVIRMLAKIRVTVKNTSASPIEVTALSFGLLNRGIVPLFPDYTALGAAPDILEEARGEKEEITFGNLDAPLSVDGAFTKTFYVRESAAVWTHPSERYFITFSIRHADGATAEEHYAVTDGLRWIQRNDFIEIPVVISDLTIDWSVSFYPPIGGYPAVMTEADGDSHFMTFDTAGKFRIRPEIKENGEVIGAADFDFAITGIEGESTIFSRLPERDPVTGEITGELSAATGSAILSCTVTVRSSGSETVRNRKIYIIRK